MTISDKSIERQLAEACVAFREVELPPATVAAAEQCIINWLGCAVAGVNEAPARADGRVLTQEMRTRKGDPENPLTDADLEHKFARLIDCAGVCSAPVVTWVRGLAAGARIDHETLSAAMGVRSNATHGARVA